MNSPGTLALTTFMRCLHSDLTTTRTGPHPHMLNRSRYPWIPPLPPQVASLGAAAAAATGSASQLSAAALKSQVRGRHPMFLSGDHAHLAHLPSYVSLQV